MTAKDFVANGSRADEKRGWRYDLIRKDIDVEKTKGMVPGGTGRAAGGLPAVGVQVGERNQPSGSEPHSGSVPAVFCVHRLPSERGGNHGGGDRTPGSGTGTVFRGEDRERNGRTGSGR